MKKNGQSVISSERFTWIRDVEEDNKNNIHESRKELEIQSTLKANNWTSRFVGLTSRKLKVSFYFICLIGCIYQIIEVSILYFEYQTISNLKIERPKEIFPPSMSICFPYIQLIDFNLAFKLYPQLKSVAEAFRNQTNEQIDFVSHQMLLFKVKQNGFDYKFSQHLEEYYTIDAILSMTKSIDDIFMRCVLIDPFDYSIIETDNLDECRSIWIMDYYIKDEKKCFLFSFKPINHFNFKKDNQKKQPTIYNLEQLSSTFSWRELLMQIRLNVTTIGKKAEKMYLFLHPYNRLPFGRVDPSVVFRNPSRNVTFTFTYSRVFNQLLEAPYESNCKTYPHSRGASVDECTKSKSLKLYNKVPFTMLFQKHANYSIIGFKKITENKSLEYTLKQIYKDCTEEIKEPDCVSEVFRPEMLGINEGGNNLKLEINIPSSLDVITQLDPKLSFLEYIIYNGSTFGFWFGFCIIHLIDGLTKFMKRNGQLKI